MAIYSKLIEGLNNGDEMFVKVFTVNPKGRVNNRVDLPFASAIPSAFPAEPSAYELISTYTSTTTFTAPEDGWYQIELFGASGNGGAADGTSASNGDRLCASGGSGGGGAYARSIIKLNAGDTVVFTSPAIGSTAAVYINSSIEVYPNILAISGSNGGNGYASNSSLTGGNGGAGGVASGGNININGNAGSKGEVKSATSSLTATTAPSIGGAPGHADGNIGGNGGYYQNWTKKSQTSGKTAFIKIYRGDTNIVA